MIKPREAIIPKSDQSDSRSAHADIYRMRRRGCEGCEGDDTGIRGCEGCEGDEGDEDVGKGKLIIKKIIIDEDLD